MNEFLKACEDAHALRCALGALCRVFECAACDNLRFDAAEIATAACDLYDQARKHSLHLEKIAKDVYEQKQHSIH